MATPTAFTRKGVTVPEFSPTIPVEVCHPVSRQPGGNRRVRRDDHHAGHLRIHGSMPRTAQAYCTAGFDGRVSFVASIGFVNRPFLLFQCMFGSLQWTLIKPLF